MGGMAWDRVNQRYRRIGGDFCCWGDIGTHKGMCGIF